MFDLRNGRRHMKLDRVSVRRPTAPGEILYKEFLEEHGITQERFAKAIRMSRLTVNQIINGKRSITAVTALKLAKATGTTPDFWLGLQLNLDLYEANLELGEVLEKIKPVIKAPKLSKLFYDLPAARAR